MTPAWCGCAVGSAIQTGLRARLTMCWQVKPLLDGGDSVFLLCYDHSSTPLSNSLSDLTLFLGALDAQSVKCLPRGAHTALGLRYHCSPPTAANILNQESNQADTCLAQGPTRWKGWRQGPPHPDLPVWGFKPSGWKPFHCVDVEVGLSTERGMSVLSYGTSGMKNVKFEKVE